MTYTLILPADATSRTWHLQSDCAPRCEGWQSSVLQAANDNFRGKDKLKGRFQGLARRRVRKIVSSPLPRR